MNNRFFSLFLTLILLGFSGQCFADLANEIKICSNTKNNKARLACFDTISSNIAINDKAKPELATIKPAIKAQALPEETFGQPNENKLLSIKSKIVGEFKGWNNGVKLVLENGQIWKVVSRKSGNYNLLNPEIIIRRGFFGSFEASVEGINTKGKVKRLK
jgi:hypothetical protein